MIIDSHQHFWKYNNREYGWMSEQMQKLKRDHLPKDLSPVLKENSVDGTVVVQARQTMQETEWLLDLADENEFIKGVVGWVDLRNDRIAEMLSGFCSDDKLKGVRHVLHDEPNDRFMLNRDFIYGIAQLEKFNLTYDLLIFPKHVEYAVELVNMFPNQKFVVDHIAKPFIKAGTIEPWKADMQKLAAADNVCCKISGMVTEAAWNEFKYDDFIPYMEAILEMFGTGRVMFGSDWPVCTVAAQYNQVLKIVTDFISTLSSDEQSDVLGKNAVRFYDLRV